MRESNPVYGRFLAFPGSRQWLTVSGVVFGVLVVVFVGLRLWNLTAYGIWGGEAFTVIGSRDSWSGMFEYIIADVVHPPLIYVLLKLWIMIGGTGDVWMKLLPALIGIATVVPFYLLCRELRLPRSTINVALALFTVNGFVIHYTQELRMYVLLMFLGVVSLWLFARYFQQKAPRPRLLLALTVVNLLMVYSHYYGWLVIGMEFLFLLLTRHPRLKPFTVSSVVIGILFLPWVVLVARAAVQKGGLGPNLDWIPRPRIEDAINMYANFDGFLPFRGQEFVGLAVFGLPVLLTLAQRPDSDNAADQHRYRIMIALALFVIVPPAFLFVVSWFFPQAVWISRYFIFITIPYLLLVALAVDRLRPPLLRVGAVAVVLGWGLLAGVHDLQTNRMAWQSPQVGSRIDWPGLTRQMSALEADATAGIPIYTLTVTEGNLRTGDWATWTSLEYYLDLLGDERFAFVYAVDTDEMLANVDRFPFWAGYYVVSPEDAEVREQLIAQGYQIDQWLVFRNLDQYFALIRVTGKEGE